MEIGGIYRARYWKELVDTMGTFSGIVGRVEGPGGLCQSTGGCRQPIGVA